MATATQAPALPRERFPRLARIISYLDSLTGRADLDVLSDLLADAPISRADIEPACLFGQNAYRRNTISESPWYDLLALAWRSGHCPPIHDHRGVSCAFKVIEVRGPEIRFRLP